MRTDIVQPGFECLEPRLVMTAAVGAAAESAAPLPQAETWSSAAWANDVQWIRDQFGLTGAGQTVAVIDSGVAYDHYALGGGLGSSHRVVGGWDFAEQDADPYDDAPAGFHGTHVAGIIGSSDDTYSGIAEGVDLVALRVFDDQGASSFAWVADALQWVDQNQFAFEHPITTVNLSLGIEMDQLHPADLTRLEDGLATLESKGIFIAVSAGNQFEGAIELTYPAASQYVVPVTSVSATGELSSFSQRDPRVLAAPGEWITSTVPDYLFGFDGRPDDFFSVSGTSAAAPHIAGASVLVREALELAGDSHVTQDEINLLLRSTADLIFDEVTNQTYHRVNLQDALAAAMPTDDHGNTAGLATALGTLSSSRPLQGTMERIGDVDYFSVTPLHSGRLTIHVQDGLGLQLISDAASSANGSLTIDVSAGEDVRFGIQSQIGIGHYAAVVTLTPTSVPAVPAAPSGGLTESHLRWIPTQSGAYQIQLDFENALAVSHVALYDGALNPVFISSQPRAQEQIDVWVNSVQAYELVVRGRETSLTFAAVSTSASAADDRGAGLVTAVDGLMTGERVAGAVQHNETMAAIRALAQSPLPRVHVEEAIDALFAEMLPGPIRRSVARPTAHGQASSAGSPSTPPAGDDALPVSFGIDVVFADTKHHPLTPDWA
ncbi:MAG: S8 family serine peptidase [Planctomycetota bacterium]